MDACVIGLGVVGKATADVFGIKKTYDIQPEKTTITLEEASKCRFVFICLPTEVDDNGKYFTSDIADTIKQIESYGTNCIYIIRCTVWAGFAQGLQDYFGINRIVSNPEFLTQKTAEQDSKNPPFIILGGGSNFVEEVAGFYAGRFKSTKIIRTDNTTAETAKLALNGFFATKVIYANEIYDYCQTTGANFERVREVLEGHPFGYRNHGKIWFDGKRGVNGRCLPKDSKALSYYSKGELITKVVELNKKYIDLKE